MREEPVEQSGDADLARLTLRRLLWLYFVLLIFEGALRKWLVPSLSSPLLLIRDPVVIALYWVAMRDGLFPMNGFVKSLMMLACLFFIAGLVATITAEKGNLLVPIYGLRANFLHLPLIFLIPVIVDRAELDKFGKWMLIIAIPMAVIMVLQFKAGPNDWLNAAAGEGHQIDSADGKIRPAGTFSFVTGVVSFLSMTTSYLLYGLVEEGKYSIFLLASSGMALATSLAVSGSRSAVYTCAIVGGMLAICMLTNSRLLMRAYRPVALIVIVLAVASSTEFFSEGLTTTTHRFSAANANESIVLRMVNTVLAPFEIIADVPLIGYGLGVGTNAGSFMVSGKISFLLAEGEWSRVVLESGPILGLIYLGLRMTLACILGWRSLLAAKAGDSGPLLLYGACMVPLINGQFGQTTILGFTVFTAGLCLAGTEQFSYSSEPELEAVLTV